MPSFSTARSWRLLLAALVCAASAACSYNKDSQISLADADYRAKYPIRVESNLVQANFVGTGAGQLTLDELVQLDQVVNDYIANGQKPLVIVMPNNALEYRNLASEIERRVMLRHLARSEVLLGVDPEAAMNDEVTVSYLMHTAIAPECGYFHDDQGFNDDNDNSDNFGCASQRNLALMVANPGDLVQPQPFSTRDAQRTADIIASYRAGENPQATWPVDSGKAQIDFGSTNP